ncbi:MAG: hypothetical protein F4Z32_00805 [Gemmatimonadetes bacterium]|nr:hypothetical protein [Gemmatimonadota bacterium]
MSEALRVPLCAGQRSPVPVASRGSRDALRLIGCTMLFAACTAVPDQDRPSGPPWEIPVVVVRYLPTSDGDVVDISATGDWGESLAYTRRKTDSLTAALIVALEDGSRYRAFADPAAPPSLRYHVVHTEERLEPLPVLDKPGHEVPMTDYGAIAAAHDFAGWVEDEGVKEVWIWGYHGGVIDLWESNMAGPWGDVSNSDRDTLDLPVTGRTYTVYHYNYQRGLPEATENHMHQLEAVINAADGRDSTPDDAWGDLLFWGKFVGSDISHRIVSPRCGWSHFPPNAERDYDWANRRFVETDCEDWRPGGMGATQQMNCERWGCTGLGWFRYWSQNIPGAGHALSYDGRPLTNWWRLIGDYDGAMREGYGLVER